VNIDVIVMETKEARCEQAAPSRGF